MISDGKRNRYPDSLRLVLNAFKDYVFRLNSKQAWRCHRITSQQTT